MATPDRTLLTEADLVTPSPLKTALDGKASKNHRSTHATGGSDPITPASIGAYNATAINSYQAPGQPSGGWAAVDLKLITQPGRYADQGAGVDAPVKEIGYLDVVVTPSGSYLTQVYTTLSGKMFSRYRNVVGGAWSAWVRTDAGAVTPAGIGALENRGTTIADGVNLNDLVTPGTYYRYALAGTSAELNYPGTGVWAGWITVIGTTVGTILQVAYSARPESAAGGRYDHIDNSWYRARNGTTWGAWSRLNSGPIEGVGSPQGVVRAPVGTEYIDKDSTNGAWKWLKKSGTANWTGWVVTEGDTGWRKVTYMSAWAPNFVAEKEHIRRVGNQVTYTGQISTFPAGTYFQTPAVVETGFRPPAVMSAVGFPLSRYPGSSAVEFAGSLGINSSGTLTFKSAPGSSNVLIYFSATWLTDDPWPSTLPGTPA